MYKTVFHISKMDCPSEEQMIRMKLDGLNDIHSMQFELPARKLSVYHTQSHTPIFERLDSLNFNTTILESLPVDTPAKEANQSMERKLLWQVLAINFFFFVLEMITGLISSSMGLVADSLDMLADSLVYGLALLAVGGSVVYKKNIAKASGVFQMILAVLGIVEVTRRFMGHGETPVFQTMIIISFLALLGNGISLYLLQKNKSREVHMQASMIFTSNDIIINLGVIVAGALVYLTQSKVPDLVIGAIVFIIVVKGAFKILSLSR